MIAHIKPKSLLRYLLLELAIGAAIINIIINAIMGILFYGNLLLIKMQGATSVITDTLLTIFLIVMITAALVLRAAKEEAFAGKVRGLELTSTKKLFHIPPFFFGILGVLILGPLLLSPWLLTETTQITSDTFIAYKAITSGITAFIVTPLFGFIGLSQSKDRTKERFENKASDGAIEYPYDYLDKACLACADPAFGCSVAPIWRLTYSGEISETAFRQAIKNLVLRYPSLKTKTRALDALPSHATHFAYLEDPDWSEEKMFNIVDLKDPQNDENTEEKARAIYDNLRENWIEMLDDPPVHVTLIQKNNGGCMLWQQQHAIADGRAFIELLNDFGTYLQKATELESIQEIIPIHRRAEQEAFATHGSLKGWFWAGAIAFFRQKMRAKSRPITRLPSNTKLDFFGENDAVHLVLSDALLAQWKPARKAIKVGLSAWLLAAILIAIRRWSIQENVKPGWTVAQLAAETRPRDGFRSFANHLSTFNIGIDLSEQPDPIELMQSIHAQMIQDRDKGEYLKRAFFENKMVHILPMHKLRKEIFATKHPETNLAFSNLIALPFPTMQGAGWKVERLRIMTPNVPPHGLVPTVTRYNGELVFNFNFKNSVITRTQTEKLVTIFERVLNELG